MRQTIQKVAQSYLPSSVARPVKRLAIWPRYFANALACRHGFKKFGHLYPQRILFIAGLPKSGSTWLKKMISCYPGFHELLIPEANIYDLSTGEGYKYNLPNDIFKRFKDILVVTKMHVHGSLHNVELLRSAEVKYVVLYRDLRDVAVSYYFYTRQTPWHPEHSIYSKLSVVKGIETFAENTLLSYADWVRSWHKNRDPKISLEIRYEQMLSNTISVITRVAKHFELDSSQDTIKEIVESHSFQKMSGRRNKGKEDKTNFFRKGVSGDWKNYFTPELKSLYKEIIGDFLIEFGYEQDFLW